MLALKNRLRKKKDFESVFKNGKSIKQDSLYLKYKENKLDETRFGIIVGKNYSKKAVSRNKIKRRIRDIIRSKITKIKTGLDAVVVVMPGADDDYKKLEEIMDKLFNKL